MCVFFRYKKKGKNFELYSIVNIILIQKKQTNLTMEGSEGLAAWVSLLEPVEEIRNNENNCPIPLDGNIQGMLFSSVRETGTSFNRGATPDMVAYMWVSLDSRGGKLDMLEEGDDELEGVTVPEGKVPWLRTKGPVEEVILTDENGRNPVYAENGEPCPIEWTQNAREEYAAKKNAPLQEFCS